MPKFLSQLATNLLSVARLINYESYDRENSEILLMYHVFPKDKGKTVRDHAETEPGEIRNRALDVAEFQE